MRKKVIIIGSGLGGLSTGVILAKNGYDVTVLEQGAQIGGCLQCFTRKGVKFETGMHFIGSAYKGQLLDKLLHFLEIADDIQLSKLDEKGYDVISLNGKRYKFPNSREAFIEQMTAYFPDQEENLNRYFDLIEHVAQDSSLHSLRFDENDRTECSQYYLRSINDVIENQLVTNPELANVLVGNLPLYAAERDKTPFSLYAFIMDFYNPSSYRIVGGSDSIAKALTHRIMSYGGEIRTHMKVTKIVCDETHAIGVEMDDATFIPADYVISSAHPVRTLEMINSKLIRPVFRSRINNMSQSVGVFSVYLHFKKDVLPYMNYNFYGYRNASPWNCEQYTEESWPKNYIYMHFCQEENPRFAQSGIILAYMRMEDVAPWLGTKVGHRGEEYEAFKKRKAEKLLDCLEKDFPGIRDSVEEYYTSTPLTYLDYTGTERGAMYGVAKDINIGMVYPISHRTKVPNVLLTGQNINSHGMLGVLIGSLITCSDLLPANTISRQIQEANQ